MFERLQIIGCDAFVADVLGVGDIIKVDLGIKVDFLSFLLFRTGGRRVGGREETEGLKVGQSPSTPSSTRNHKDHGELLVRDRSRSPFHASG